MTRRISRLAISLAFGLLLSFQFGAPTSSRSAEAADCEFRLGFAALKSDLPRTIGDCVENERHSPTSGDALQRTTQGLLVWRKADNFTAFTDGFRSWIAGPNGIAERRNSERFDWETDPTDLALLSTAEWALANEIDDYRRAFGLAPIPRSTSLTRVAKTHVRDLQRNPPQSPCNMHSWSANGAWSPVCYTPDHAQAARMWSKPLEIASYPGAGFEIALKWPEIDGKAATRIVEAWRSSATHDAIIRQTGQWSGRSFSAMGVGIFGDYAVVWFGEVPDPAGPPDRMR